MGDEIKLNTDHTDSEPPEWVHPETLEQQNPWIFIQIFYSIIGIFSNYGWFILIGGLIILYLKKKLQPKLDDWIEKREMFKEAAEYHKNPDKFIAREREIAEARMRMQVQYDQLSKEHAELMKQREEQKRQAMIENYDRTQRGESLKERPQASAALPVTNKDKKVKPKLRPEFNPLMDGGACGWRPSRRGGAGGG